jgi:hypothetical protein
MIELEFVPRRAALLANQDNALDVLVRVKSRAAPESDRERPPLHYIVTTMSKSQRLFSAAVA